MTEQIEQVITHRDIDRYWKAQVRAVDRWEWLVEHDKPQDEIEAAWEEIESWTRLAEEVEASYRQQYRCRIYDENGKWHICQHPNARPISDNPNPLDECYKCPDCGAWLDENLEVVRTPTQEIPY